MERVAARARLGNTPIRPGFGSIVEDRIREFDPDVVVGHTPVPFAAEMAFGAARRAHAPFVATYHAGRLRAGRPFLRPLAWLNRVTLERRMLSGAARLIAVAPYVRDHALARHRGRVTIVPPGVDQEWFCPNDVRPGPTVLFVGPLSRSYRWKGVDVLWRAFKLVQERVLGARLVLVGDGDRRKAFERRAAYWGPSVQILGRISDADLRHAYRSAGVVVLPSLTDAESCGMVLVEANACGRPVVGSRVGGIPDFVADGENGYLSPPGDASGLADRIVKVLRDPRLADAMGKAGRARVVEHHDWDLLARRTEATLQAAAGH